MRLAGLFLSGLVLFAGGAAVAKAPSAACRDGAAPCRDAWNKLAACQAKAKAKAPGACKADKDAADQACKAADAACDEDGSRVFKGNAPARRKS